MKKKKPHQTKNPTLLLKLTKTKIKNPRKNTPSTKKCGLGKSHTVQHLKARVQNFLYLVFPTDYL